MAKFDDILEKAFEGRVSTDENLNVQEEELGRRKSSSKVEPVGSFTFNAGGIRSIGNISASTLLTENAVGSQPNFHPSRSRRLVQEHFLHGGDPLIEGTGGEAFYEIDLAANGITTNLGTVDAVDDTIFEDDDGEDLSVLSGEGGYLRVDGSVYEIIAYNVGAVDRIQVDSSITAPANSTYEILAQDGLFRTNGVDFSSVPALSGDEVLILSNTPGGLGGDNLGVFSVQSISGDVITIDGAFGGTVDGPDPEFGKYAWEIVDPNPARLLPYGTNVAAGEETTYMAVLPEKWPVAPSPFFPQKDADYTFSPSQAEVTLSSTYDGSVDSTGQRLVMTVNNGGSQEHTEGDYFTIQGVGVFRVRSSTYPGADGSNSEDLTLTPFFNVDITNLDISSLTSGASIQKIYRVEDFFAQNTGLSGLNGYSPKNSAGLELIRVRNLINPADRTDTNYGSVSFLKGGAPSVSGRNQYSRDFLTPSSSLEEGGFGVVLYPDDGTGSPDFSSPVYDLENVRIDPDKPNQKIVVDYDEGLIQLPIPIKGNGDLDPNTFTDADGRKRLYASFFSYNGGTNPEQAAELRSRKGSRFWDAQGANDTRIRFQPRNTAPTRSAEEDGPTWLIEFPEESSEDIYHPFNNGTTNENGGHQTKLGFNSSEEGAELRFSYRDKTNGLKHFAAIGQGSGAFTDVTDTVNQLYFMPRAESVSDDYPDDNKPKFSKDVPHMRLVDGQKRVISNNPETYTIAGSEQFTANINRVDVDVNLSLTGGTYTAEEIASDLESQIDAGTSLDSTTGEYSVEAVNIDGDVFIMIEAEEFLQITASALATLVGWPTGVYRGKSVELTWGHTDSAQESFVYDGSFKQMTWNGQDVVINEKSGGSEALASLAGLGKVDRIRTPRFVVSGFDLVSPPPGAVFELTAGEIKHQGSTNQKARVFTSFNTNQEFDVGPLGVGTYYLYFDPDTEKLSAIDVTDPSFDATFKDQGVPLYKFSSDGNTVVDYVDVRDQGQDETFEESFTLGTNVGRFRDLHGVFDYIKDLKSEPSSERYVIELVEDITVAKADQFNSGNIDLVSNIEFRGNGHTVTVDNYSGSYLFGFPDSGIEHVTFRDVTFVPGTGSDTATLFSSLALPSPGDEHRHIVLENVNVLEDAGATQQFDHVLIGGRFRNLRIAGGRYETTNAFDFTQVVAATIENCEVGSDVFSATQFDFTGCQNVKVSSCFVNVVSGAINVDGQSKEILFEAVTVEGDPASPIEISQGSRVAFRDCDVLATTTRVCSLTGTSLAHFEGCDLNMGGPGAVFDVDNGSEVSVSNSKVWNDSTGAADAVILLSNDTPATGERTQVKFDRCDVWASDAARIFSVGLAGSQDSITLEFHDSRIAAQTNSQFGDRDFVQVVNSRLVLDNCECAFGFEFEGSTNNTVIMRDTEFSGVNDLGVDTSVAAFQPYILVDGALAKISNVRYFYSGTTYTKGDHANTASLGTIAEPFEIMFYQCTVRINGLQVGADSVLGTGTVFCVVEDSTSTIQGFRSIQAGGGNDSIGLYIYRDQPKCVIHGAELIGDTDSFRGILVNGDGVDNPEKVVISDFSASGYPDDGGTGDNLAIELGANGDNHLVAVGIVDAPSGTTLNPVFDNTTNSTIDPSVILIS